MTHAAITSYVDVAQLVLYLFWIAFFGLVYYLQRESKREGFPLENHTPSGRFWTTPGLIGMPNPKVYKTADGHEYHAPNPSAAPEKINARYNHRFNGAPLDPVGNPLLAGVGPGAFAARADRAEMTTHGEPLIVPLRVLGEYGVAKQDTNPIGLPVLGADGHVAGRVVDLWLDRAEMVFRHVEVDVHLKGGVSRRALVPMNFCRINRGAVTVKSILANQFADVPKTQLPEQITMLEEEKIMAYYGAGTLYATPQRSEVWL
jgi:photosynthetic reaction center H subunit